MNAEYVNLSNLPKIKKLILIFLIIATGWPTARCLASTLPKLDLNERYPFKAFLKIVLSKQKHGTKPKLQLTQSREKVSCILKKGSSGWVRAMVRSYA